MLALRQIVVGIDFSEPSVNALSQAIRLGHACERTGGAAVRAVHVIERSLVDHIAASSHIPVEAAQATVIQRTRENMQRLVDREHAGTLVTVEVIVGSPASELLRIAGEYRADVMVLGSIGAGHPAGNVGATASRCVRHGRTNVLLVRGGPGNLLPFERIVACVDFSEASTQTLREAIAIARHDRSAIDALHVFSPPPAEYPISDVIGPWPMGPPDYAEYVQQLRDESESSLAELVKSVGAGSPDVAVTPVLVENGSYSLGICSYANEAKADLVIIGTHGRSNIRYMLVGSTAEKVVRDAACSVLAVKPADAQGGHS